jgi:hypothetical protein
MNNYNITVNTEKEKYEVINQIKSVGAILTGVSGYYDGYYIQLNATPEQVHVLNKMLGGVA